MEKFTPEQVEGMAQYIGQFHSEHAKACSGMLLAYAERLREDAMDTKILDFLDAHPKLIVRSGKQAIRPLILAAMIEQGKGDEKG